MLAKIHTAFHSFLLDLQIISSFFLYDLSSKLNQSNHKQTTIKTQKAKKERDVVSAFLWDHNDLVPGICVSEAKFSSTGLNSFASCITQKACRNYYQIKIQCFLSVMTQWATTCNERMCLLFISGCNYSYQYQTGINKATSLDYFLNTSHFILDKWKSQLNTRSLHISQFLLLFKRVLMRVPIPSQPVLTKERNSSKCMLQANYHSLL